MTPAKFEYFFKECLNNGPCVHSRRFLQQFIFFGFQVDIEVNGNPVDIHMKLDDNGAAFFVEGLEEDHEDLPPELATSPLPQLDEQERPAWDEVDREAVNRSLSKEFDQEIPEVKQDDATEDTVDEAPAILLPNDPTMEIHHKSKLSKSKRKRKTRAKHTRNSSKSSLKEVVAVSDYSVPIEPEAKVEEAIEVIVDTNVRKSSEIDVGGQRCSETAEHSLLLSRLPKAEQLDSLVVDDDEDSSNDSDLNRNKTGKEGNSLPLSMERQLQYYSEPEISPGSSPMGSRPGSPVSSDTEYETRGQRGSKEGKEASEQQSWEWGKLPSSTTPQHKESKSNKAEEAAKKEVGDEAANKDKSGGWGFSYLFRGGQPKKKAGGEDEKPGVYLEDLKGDDEEMMKIYLGSRHRSGGPRDLDNEDAESGNGTSLPMSPNSVEGSIGYHPGGPDDETTFKHLPVVDISFCGGLDADTEEEFSPVIFEQNKVSFDDFAIQLEERPALLTDPNLVIKIGEHYHKWETAAPIIMSHVLYGRSLPPYIIDKLKGNSKNKTEADKSADDRKKASWWPFGSRKEKEDALTSTPKTEGGEDVEAGTSTTETATIIEGGEHSTTRKRRLDTTSSSSEAESETEKAALGKEKYKKTLRLTSDAIQCLNLKPGANELQFSVTTAYQGTTRCSCHVYLWKDTDKIVISDIDGTITKSDVLGHVLPIIGRDWAQSGVASLFSKVVNNGYHIVYLSARAIGQASITKDYLASIKQGEVNLPDGPMFLNPTSLVNAFHREVIEKKPEEFKIACLRDIQKLFPTERNPFYAGYGNRVNVSYWIYSRHWKYHLLPASSKSSKGLLFTLLFFFFLLLFLLLLG
jgi:phosphatidate phosphatase LPIN